MDRTFLLADDRPARETIYPAATRHREAIDVYVNRAPLALDVADRRADSDRDAPVTDGEIRAHLAERWSRARPKEAALDYLADGAREELAEGVREREHAARPGLQRGASDPHMEEPRTAANDNALTRIARDVRRTAFCLAPRRGRRRLRRRQAGGDGGVGRAAREDARGGRCGGARRYLPRDPGPARGAAETGRTLPGASGGLRSAARGTRPHRSRRPRRIRGAARPGPPPPPRRDHAADASRQARDRTPGASDRDTKGRAARARGGRRGGVPRTARLVRFRPTANRRGPCRGHRRGGVGGARGLGAACPGAPEARLALRLGAGDRGVERADRSCPAVGHDRVLHGGLTRN